MRTSKRPSSPVGSINRNLDLGRNKADISRLVGMHKSHALVSIPAAVGALFALHAFLGPFGNTGVDGTLGAALAALGSLVAAVLVFAVIIRPLPRRRMRLLFLLAMIAAGLTALAAFFLMQTALMIAMILTLLATTISLFVGRRPT